MNQRPQPIPQRPPYPANPAGQASGGQPTGRPPHYVVGPPRPDAPPTRSSGGPSRSTIVLLLIVGLLVAGGIAVAVLTQPTPASRAEPGQCIDRPKEGEYAYVTDCDSPDAVYQVLGSAKSVSKCLEIAGTTSVYQTESTTVCLAGKDEDPSRALNTVVAGDCLKISPVTTGDSQEAAKSECVAGAYPVASVLRDIDQFKVSMGSFTGSNVCEDSAPEAAMTYSWSIDRTGLNTFEPLKWDFVYCLTDPLK